MGWKKGQSGNPLGRAIEVARKLVDAGYNPSENVYIPVLDKRDPAKELIKLADISDDIKFKADIWKFLFQEKYKSIKIIAKPAQAKAVEVMSDADMLRALETQAEIKPVESNPRASSVESITIGK